MSHQHTNYVRPRLFRVYCTNQYYANRDEYEGFRQVQPHSFEEYVAANLAQLKEGFRSVKRNHLSRLAQKG